MDTSQSKIANGWEDHWNIKRIWISWGGQNVYSKWDSSIQQYPEIHSFSDVCEMWTELNESNIGSTSAWINKCSMPTKSRGMNFKIREVAKDRNNQLSRENGKGGNDNKNKDAADDEKYDPFMKSSNKM